MCVCVWLPSALMNSFWQAGNSMLLCSWLVYNLIKLHLLIFPFFPFIPPSHHHTDGDVDDDGVFVTSWSPIPSSQVDASEIISQIIITSQIITTTTTIAIRIIKIKLQIIYNFISCLSLWLISLLPVPPFVSLQTLSHPAPSLDSFLPLTIVRSRFFTLPPLLCYDSPLSSPLF